MACCILILLYVRDELSYDRFHAHAGRIYRVADEFELPAQNIKAATALTPYPMGKALVAEFPQVLDAVCLHQWSNERKRVGRGDRWFYETGILYAEPSFFQVFTFPLRQGAPQVAPFPLGTGGGCRL